MYVITLRGPRRIYNRLLLDMLAFVTTLRLGLGALTVGEGGAAVPAPPDGVRLCRPWWIWQALTMLCLCLSASASASTDPLLCGEGEGIVARNASPRLKPR